MATCDRSSPEGVEGRAHAQPEVAQYPPSGAFSPEVDYRKWRHFPRAFFLLVVQNVGWDVVYDRSQVAMYLYYNSSSNTKCSGCSCAHDQWRHFRWKGPTSDIAKLPVVHAHNILPVPGRASSGHVTSGDVTSGCSPLLSHKYDFVRTHILLMYLHLNNWEFWRVKSENMTLFMLSLIF
jgi:hypothetical protein